MEKIAPMSDAAAPSRPVPIHVVIATHGRQQLLARTLQSLAACHKPARLEAVWVIENGSDAGARQICHANAAALPIRYQHRAEAGKAQALQQILDQLDSGLMLMTDDDVRFASRWLLRYEQAYRDDGLNCFWGGPVAIDYERQPPDWLKVHLPPSARGFPDSPQMAQQLESMGLKRHDPISPIQQPCLLGANYAAPVEALKQVGGFSKVLGTGAADNPVGEEEDLQTRLMQAGYVGHLLLEPDATVWHHVPPSRCAASWVLRRHERIWLTSSLTGSKPQHTGPLLAGLPRWMWRRWAVLAFRALISCLEPDARKRFAMRLPYFQYRGKMRGLRRRLLQADASISPPDSS